LTLESYKHVKTAVKGFFTNYVIFLLTETTYVQLPSLIRKKAGRLSFAVFAKEESPG